MTTAGVIVIAFLLDAIFGDPYCIPHPICLIGKLIAKGEKALRKVFYGSEKKECIGGMLLSIGVILISFLVPAAIIWGLSKIHWSMAVLLQIWFCFQIFAAKSLKKESMKVYSALKAQNLPEARKYLSYIVGRDTESLLEEAVAKAAVETVAENTSDGVIAPLFFMAIGGAPLAFAYKAVNTLDSMIGYKNEQYLYFGRFAAKLDDVCNYIPARLSGILMIAAAFVTGFDGKSAARIYRRDRRKHASPNSAQTESVCAGALHIQLAGNASYFGKLYHKPTIGDEIRHTEAEDIRCANRLMYGTSIIGVILLSALRMTAEVLILILC
ncbi:MAG: adenosylcobinamide-phosphate synthase CbiB [Clostridiales bacterium]|nr:adenosylcobinamide-phosphate synthase CbiB [Clostridiales bacterium]